ncbi:MAG: hypothetical protein JW891_18080 [Candidatus Lokiarchaeota archaeon]|nr:hypothetical protein [Candidatus Lokiarchaeota archaeon]
MGRARLRHAPSPPQPGLSAPQETFRSGRYRCQKGVQGRGGAQVFERVAFGGGVSLGRGISRDV